MSRLDKIIRPFTEGDVTPPKRVPAAYEVDAEPIKLVFGKNGSGKVMSGSGSATVTKYMDTKYKESRDKS